MSSDKVDRRVWIEGYYPPDMDAEGGWEVWQHTWTMGPTAQPNWIWIRGDWMLEEQAREALSAGKRYDEL